MLVMQGPRLMEQPPFQTCHRERGALGNLHASIYVFCLEATHVLLAHISLVRINYMAPYSMGARKYDPGPWEMKNQ